MSKKILVCDDDIAVSEMLKIMLEEEGYKVKLLQNGKGIKKKILEFKPNLILVDLWMPGMDGKEVIKLLTTDSETSKIPILVISALHENEISKLVRLLGVQGYITKPFDLMELISLVNKHSI